MLDYICVCKEVFNVRMIVRKLNFSSKKGITCSEDVLVAISCDDRLIKTTEANEIFIAAADFGAYCLSVSEVVQGHHPLL